MDEDECDRRRMEYIDDMNELSKQFYKIKDQYVVFGLFSLCAVRFSAINLSAIMLTIEVVKCISCAF